MEFKQVYPSDKTLTHAQRKHYAFRKSVKFQLKIPVDLVQTGKRYYIHSFHWPIILIQQDYSFVTKGTCIQTALNRLNCHELIEFKQVYPSDKTLTHAQQRKHYAFRKSVNLPGRGTQYWPNGHYTVTTLNNYFKFISFIY